LNCDLSTCTCISNRHRPIIDFQGFIYAALGCQDVLVVVRVYGAPPKTPYLAIRRYNIYKVFALSHCDRHKIGQQRVINFVHIFTISITHIKTPPSFPFSYNGLAYSLGFTHKAL